MHFIGHKKGNEVSLKRSYTNNPFISNRKIKNQEKEKEKDTFNTLIENLVDLKDP